MDPETQHHMRSFADAINKTAAAHNKLAQEVQQRQQEAAAEKMIEALTKIISASYEKAVAYTNVVLVAGYASFFALWSSTKPVLSDSLAIAAALLMTFSATIFVLFELYKMIQTARFFSQHQGLLTDPQLRKDLEAFQTKLKEFENLQRK